jgi:hypothetical protein
MSHCDLGNESRHLAAETEMLARAEAEMALRPTLDVCTSGSRNLRQSRLPDPKASATLSPVLSFCPCNSVSRMTVRLKRRTEVLKRSEFLDRRLKQRRIGDDAAAAVGMIVQIERGMLMKVENDSSPVLCGASASCFSAQAKTWMVRLRSRMQ